MTQQGPQGWMQSVQWVDLGWTELALAGKPPSREAFDPQAIDLEALERAYFAWVPRLCAGFVFPRWEGSGLRVEVFGSSLLTLLEMGPATCSEGARRRPLLGGLLAEAGGSLAFEALPLSRGLRLRVAVRGLRPRLPVWLYFRLQARLHERTTLAFLRQAKGYYGGGASQRMAQPKAT